MKITFATLLTLGRLTFLPFLAWALYKHAWGIALILFIVSAITDVLDGFFARLWNQETELGACLDPVVDKLLIVTSLFVLFLNPVDQLLIPTWFLLLVAMKEVVLLSGAFYFGFVTQRVAIRPSWWGKLAMVVQSLFVMWLLMSLFWGWSSEKLLYLFLAVSTFLIVGSLLHYGWYAYKKSIC